VNNSSSGCKVLQSRKFVEESHTIYMEMMTRLGTRLIAELLVSLILVILSGQDQIGPVTALT